tara:strand:- start:97 stop:213 length:117 start_codon:yes stop_codon:yes gene_type:complete
MKPQLDRLIRIYNSMNKKEKAIFLTLAALGGIIILNLL